MLIILIFFALIHTLHGVPLGAAEPEFPVLNIRDTQDHFGQRSVNDIIISCFATIFACTWTAVHPNISSPADCWWTRFKRQVITMIYALLAPEVITAWALRQRLAARKIMDEYNEKAATHIDHQINSKPHSIFEIIRRLFQDSPSLPSLKNGKGPQWTLTHGFFLQMGGFMLCENGSPIQTLANGDSTLQYTTLIWYIKNGTIDPPRISEEDIKDRSKGDAISKIFIILQTTWFISQCIARWSQQLPVTELEVVTLGFAMLNGITYGLWWNKPQNVGRPVFLECKTPFWTNTRVYVEESADPMSSPHPIRAYSKRESWLRRKLRQEIEQCSPYAPWVLLWRLPRRLLEAFLRPVGKLAGNFRQDAVYGNGDLRVDMFSTGNVDDDKIKVMFSIAAIGALFGCVHLIPSWFFDFPSRWQMWLWRVSAISITVEPVFLGFIAYHLSIGHEFLTRIFVVPTFLIIPFYIISRIILLALSLISLRSLPPAALRTIEWTTFIPHL